MNARILIVDDEKLTRATLEVLFSDQGFDTRTAANGFEALKLLEQADVDVVVTDLRMPMMDGLDFQRLVRERWPDTPIVFMTAFGTVKSAVEAMRKGAADYLTKPLSSDELLIRVRRLLERRRDIIELRRLRRLTADGRVAGDVVYRSPVMARVVERALSIADTDTTVLIEGETGTGKQVLARLLHTHSSRSAGPFVSVNPSELNANLIESELFGHEAGAFTGARHRRRGRFESAFGGTLLIDEVDDLPSEIQVRLLRFLEDRSFERVGSSTTLHGDVRVLCATKRSLGSLVEQGQFRSDLYYRINAIRLSLPPLRARREDVIALAEHFAKRLAGRRGLAATPEITPGALQLLTAYGWPGNVRELKHAIEHAVAFSRGNAIERANLPDPIQETAPARILQLDLEGQQSVPFDELLAAAQRELFDWALTRAGGNQTRAAALLQISRTTLRSRLAALRRPVEPGAPGPEPSERPGSQGCR